MPATKKPAAKKKKALGRGIREARRLELDFPAAQVTKPVIYELVKQYDLEPNIRRANVTSDFGYIQLELTGTPKNLEAGIRFLEKKGIRVEPLEKDVLES
jgi:ABC-type methionine transport system ATPase subunit